MKKLLLLCISLFAFAMPYNQKMLKALKLLDHHQKNFSFAVLGDNRDGDNILKIIISKINKDKDISFAINNGDLVSDGYKQEFLNYLNIIKTSKKPFISIIGNHEIPWGSNNKKNYKNFFGKTYFAFTYGNSYFIVLDSSDKKIGKKQLKWLKKELQKSQKYTNRFVITHVPLYDPRYGKYAKGHSLKNPKKIKKLNKLLDKYRVNMIFCSHIHFYYRGFWNKTPFIITGGAGAPLKKFKDNGFYNFVKVTVKGKKLKYEVIKTIGR